MKPEDERLDELLARGTLGGPRYDEIFEKVLDRSRAAEAAHHPRRWFKWLIAPLVLVPALGAWLLVVRPAQTPFTAKGVAGASGVFQIGCGVAGGVTCRAGDTLMFSVNAAVSSGHLGAYAERTDSPTPERIWYFPTSAGTAPVVAPGAGTVVLADGIHIGPEHAPGEYRLTIWLSDRALGRVETSTLGGGPLRARATLEFKVVP